jgi:serine protease AprX
VAQYFCTKPQEAPANKDNSYGYGLPAMGSMLGQMTQVNSPFQETMQVFPPMLGMVLMAGMMGAV